MPHDLESQLACAWPPDQWADVTVIVAVSGGGDSVALLRAMLALKKGGAGRVCAAHLNHQLRADAGEDERFVVSLCRDLDVPCEVERIEVERIAAASGDGIEAAARTARYSFLERAAGRLGARFIATAHTADDQAETILHRIVRGTGIRGLSGMARTRPLGHATLIRPLLGLRRRDVLAYLRQLRQPCRHDPSNADLRFTRNRIRHDAMPYMCREFNRNITDALLRLSTLAGEAQAVLDELVEELFERCVTLQRSVAARVLMAELAGRPPYLVRELLMDVWRRQGWPMQAMGREKWEELRTMVTSPAAASPRVLPGGVTASVSDGYLELRRT